MDEKIKILLAEDDTNLGMLLKEYLRAKGFDTVLCEDGEVAHEAFLNQPFDLCIFDVMMPKKDGFTLAKEVRQINSEIPIIFLTAKNMKEDVLEGFKLGADDYMAKPYHAGELVARVKSHLRRYTSLGDIHASVSSANIVNGKLCYNKEEKILYADGEAVKLTATETKIIDLLMCNLGRVFPAEEIYRRVWNEEAYAAENTVMVHIRRIREKIEYNPKEPEYLKVVWGIGYKIEKK